MKDSPAPWEPGGTPAMSVSLWWMNSDTVLLHLRTPHASTTPYQSPYTGTQDRAKRLFRDLQKQEMPGGGGKQNTQQICICPELAFAPALLH